ncbi:MAG: aminoacyl-tRNA hydrolase [Patescibacteria group bacterium]
MITIIGLGNPGEEYENTRHNTGRMILEAFRKKLCFSEWESDKKSRSLISAGKVGKEKAVLVLPETFMNKSGLSVGAFVKSKKAAESLIVVHDDLDLPLGAMKISFNRGSGGHKGIESIKRGIKTEAFIRVRIGISPATPSGKTKKPKGDKAVGDFILGKFKPKEAEVIKKLSKKVIEAIKILITEGREKAMNALN